MLKSLIKKALVLQLIFGSSVVFASIYNFTQITSNGNHPVASQLLVDVTQSGANVLFKFTNSSLISSSVTDVYFDYGNTNYFTSISNNALGVAGLNSSFSDVTTALDNNAFRIGLHVQAIGELAGSEAFVNSPEKPSQVPLPGAIWLFGSAVLGFAGYNKRRP